MNFKREARIEADYTHLRTFTREEVAGILAEANQFCEMAKKIASS